MCFGIPYIRLSRFAGNLATCQEAGVGVADSLKATRRALQGRRWGDALDVVQAHVDDGKPLSDALGAVERRFPAFFVPMIRAGEQTGRLDESLRYLEHHCKMLAGPARALRNLWLIPLAVALFGTVVRLGIYLYWAPWRAVASFLWGSITSYAALATVVLVASSPPFKPAIDQLKLSLPFAGAIERQMSVNRFFHALAMLYASAGTRVENMVRVAAKTVSNRAVSADLLRVSDQIADGASIPEAFDRANYVTSEEKGLVSSGDLSGTLERSFERIANDAAERAGVQLEILRQFAVRIMLLLVTATIISTLMSVPRF